MLKLVTRIITTGIYGVKEALVTLGLHGNFWSEGDGNSNGMEVG